MMKLRVPSQFGQVDSPHCLISVIRLMSKTHLIFVFSTLLADSIGDKMMIIYPRKTIGIKCQSLFSWKNTSKLSSAEIPIQHAKR